MLIVLIVLVHFLAVVSWDTKETVLSANVSSNESVDIFWKAIVLGKSPRAVVCNKSVLTDWLSWLKLGSIYFGKNLWVWLIIAVIHNLISCEIKATSYISNARTKTFLDDCISVIITADGTCAGEVCHVNATCRNLIQGPTCVCKSGYQGSGKTCTGEWAQQIMPSKLLKKA